jgi:hypothetical protein
MICFLRHPMGFEIHNQRLHKFGASKDVILTLYSPGFNSLDPVLGTRSGKHAIQVLSVICLTPALVLLDAPSEVASGIRNLWFRDGLRVVASWERDERQAAGSCKVYGLDVRLETRRGQSALFALFCVVGTSAGVVQHVRSSNQRR